MDEVEATYQRLLKTIDDDDLNTIMESLYVDGTYWIENTNVNGWTMLMMNLKPLPKVCYPFLKHSIIPTAYNKIVNKEHLVFL